MSNQFIKQGIPAMFSEQIDVGTIKEGGDRRIFIMATGGNQIGHISYLDAVESIDELIAGLQRARRDAFGERP